MDQPLIDQATELPRLNSAKPTMESISAYIKSMANDESFEVHLRKKVLKNKLSFPIPQDDQITSLSKMQDGFAVGLKTGSIILVSPPSSHLLEQFHSEPVIGLFAASNYFLASATQRSMKIWNAQTETLAREVTSGAPIACLAGNMVKELLVLGLANGVIELYPIKDKGTCKLEEKPRSLHKDGEDSAAYDIKTNDLTTWLAVRYASNALILWDHGSDSMLYHLTFGAGPGLPRSWKLGDSIKIPGFFKPGKGWDVFPDCIVFSSPLLLRMTGNRISNMYSSRRLVEPDDNRWQAIGDSLKKGHVSTLYGDTIISFTKPHVKKKISSEKPISEVEIDLELDFSLAERSEANNYMAFACEKTLEVICLAAIDTTFAHQIAGSVKVTKANGFLYSRFHKLLNTRNEELVQLGPRERVMSISPNYEWVMCTSESRDSAKCELFVIQNLHDSSKTIKISDPWNKSKLISKQFSKNSKLAVLLLSSGLIVISLEDNAVIYSIEHKFTSKVKCTHQGTVLIYEPKTLFIVDPVKNKCVEDKWEFDRVCFMGKGSNQVVAYSKTQASFCNLTTEHLTPSERLDQGFERMKSLKSGEHCIGSSEAGIFIFSVPSFAMLFHVKTGYQVIVSKKTPMIYAFCSNEKLPTYGMLDVWDLKMGLKLNSIYSGLNNVMGNKLAIRGPGMWREPTMKTLTAQDANSTVIRGTWILNLEKIVSESTNFDHEPEVSDISFLEENFDLHCILWKRLATILTVGELGEGLTNILIQPYNLNVLHLIANNSHAVLLSKALADNTAIIKSAFGSPLTICLARKSRKCLNLLLIGLIALKDADSSAFLTALYHVSDDLPELIAFGSNYLDRFLQEVIVPLPEEMLAITVIKPKFDLPQVHMSESLWVEAKNYQDPTGLESEKLTVEYLVSPFPIYVEMGSTQSIGVLKMLTDDSTDMKIFTTLVVKTILNMKWDRLWYFILVLTVLYWCQVIALVGKMFHFGQENVEIWLFVGLNTVHLLFEMLQMVTAAKEYFTEVWNYFDLGRIFLSYIWVLSDPAQWLTFLVVLLSVVRGITTFQTFDATRFYVRMIFSVVKETLAFLVVFFYSTLSFGLLFAAVEPSHFPSFYLSWVIPYQMNMGNIELEEKSDWYWLVFMFAALINIVVMLNLLVSILGDAFGNFQDIAEAADVRGKADVLYEFELMMWWARGTGTKKFVQICRDEGSADSPAEGETLDEMKKARVEAQRELSKKARGEKSKEDLLLAKQSALLDEKVAQLKHDLLKDNAELKKELAELKQLIQAR